MSKCTQEDSLQNVIKTQYLLEIGIDKVQNRH